MAPHKERLLLKRSRHHGRSAYPGPCGCPGGVPLAAGAGAVTTSWSRMLPTFRGSAAPLLRRPPDMSVHLGIEASFYIYVCDAYMFHLYENIHADQTYTRAGIYCKSYPRDCFFILIEWYIPLFVDCFFSICLHPSAKSILMFFKAM